MKRKAIQVIAVAKRKHDTDFCRNRQIYRRKCRLQTRHCDFYYRTIYFKKRNFVYALDKSCRIIDETACSTRYATGPVCIFRLYYFVHHTNERYPNRITKRNGSTEQIAIKLICRQQKVSHLYLMQNRYPRNNPLYTGGRILDT